MKMQKIVSIVAMHSQRSDENTTVVSYIKLWHRDNVLTYAVGTCGQIFDAKCTSLVSGKLFGQSGNLRVCKPCEAIIYGNDDDSSVYTEDADQTSIYEQKETSGFMDDSERSVDPTESDHTKIGTPTISIPMSRKAGEKKRRSAVIELGAPPTLA